jgi:hypothetical protein
LYHVEIKKLIRSCREVSRGQAKVNDWRSIIGFPSLSDNPFSRWRSPTRTLDASLGRYYLERSHVDQACSGSLSVLRWEMDPNGCLSFASEEREDGNPWVPDSALGFATLVSSASPKSLTSRSPACRQTFPTSPKYYMPGRCDGLATVSNAAPDLVDVIEIRKSCGWILHYCCL